MYNTIVIPPNNTKSEHGRYLQRFIPARWLFVILGFLGFNLIYGFKVVLSMSLVAMVDKNEANETSSCFVRTANSTEVHTGEFPWSTSQQTQLLGAFFYGYVLTQIPAGIISNKLGGKWIFGICLLIASLLSILGPKAARIDYRLFMVTRIGQGLAEGVVFPCMNTLISNWMPKMERSRGTTFIFTGAMIGTVITIPITAQLGRTEFLGGWPSAFYLLGFAGIVWFILWTFLVFESPESHPYISQKEHDFIISNGGGIISKNKNKKIEIPYKKILTSFPVWALTVAHFGQNWAFLTILNLMPTYMNNVLGMNVNENTVVSALPYLGQAIFSWILSFISDYLRKSGRLEITTIRKINGFIAYFPGAVCMLIIPQVGCSTFWNSVLLILVLTLNGGCFAGLNSTHVDMAPDFAGTLMGITNSLGNIPGFVATIVASQFTEKGPSVENWAWVFYISAGVYFATTFVYCVFCTAQEQPWGRVKQVGKFRVEEQNDKQVE